MSPNSHTAHDVQLVGNRIWNVPGIVAEVSSCENCVVADNDVWDSGGGVRISNTALFDTAQCAGGNVGCLPSQALRVTGNRLRGLVGNMQPGTGDGFLWFDAGEGEGFVGGANRYCANDVDGVRFGWQGMPLPFDVWQTQTGTDTDSTVLPADDNACTSPF